MKKIEEEHVKAFEELEEKYTEANEKFWKFSNETAQLLALLEGHRKQEKEDDP